MHLIMLDTCVWLDISSQKAELPMLTAIEHLVQDGSIKILLPDLIRAEYERNKDRVIEATRKRLASEISSNLKGVVECVLAVKVKRLRSKPWMMLITGCLFFPK